MMIGETGQSIEIENRLAGRTMNIFASAAKGNPRQTVQVAAVSCSPIEVRKDKLALPADDNVHLSMGKDVLGQGRGMRTSEARDRVGKEAL